MVIFSVSTNKNSDLYLCYRSVSKCAALERLEKYLVVEAGHIEHAKKKRYSTCTKSNSIKKILKTKRFCTLNCLHFLYLTWHWHIHYQLKVLYTCFN